MDVKLISDSIFDIQACIDTASGLNLFPKNLFLKLNGNLNNLETSELEIKGISNVSKKVNGKFNCVVKFNTGYVKNVSFYVIDCEIPPLLGFDFLNNETIESYTFKKNKLILNRKFGQKF